MPFLLALRNLLHTPRRTLLTMAGFALGVAAMIALLSTGEAILQQAENKALVGGGDIVLLPAGIDVEVLRVGGATGSYFAINNARLIYRQILSDPMLRDKIVAVSPQSGGRVLYLWHRGKVRHVLVRGVLPSQEQAVNARAPRAARWRDNADDRAWSQLSPSIQNPMMDFWRLLFQR